MTYHSISPTVCCLCLLFSSVLALPYHHCQSHCLLPLSAVLLCIGMIIFSLPIPLSPASVSPQWGAVRTLKLKSHLLRTQSLNILHLKPEVGQCIATNASLTARDFLLANFYTSGTFTCICSQTSPKCFPVLAVANIGFCVGPRIK